MRNWVTSAKIERHPRDFSVEWLCELLCGGLSPSPVPLNTVLEDNDLLTQAVTVTTLKLEPSKGNNASFKKLNQIFKTIFLTFKMVEKLGLV